MRKNRGPSTFRLFHRERKDAAVLSSVKEKGRKGGTATPDLAPRVKKKHQVCRCVGKRGRLPTLTRERKVSHREAKKKSAGGESAKWHCPEKRVRSFQGRAEERDHPISVRGKERNPHSEANSDSRQGSQRFEQEEGEPTPKDCLSLEEEGKKRKP